MASLIFNTLLIIFFQTAFVVVLSWVTLSCRFPPSPAELEELTLMKLLYLHDPAACGRVESYNFTMSAPGQSTMSTVVWPVRNEVAAKFRWKLKLSLSLHILWLSLGVCSALSGRRRAGLLLAAPFTAAGAALLASDVYIVATYLLDVEYASTEGDILRYIGADGDYLGVPPSSPGRDTTWLPLLFAYVSSRAIVLWVINYWLVLDNFTAGLAAYRAMKKAQMIPKKRRRERYDFR